jgi:hypothetical protein
MPSPTPITLAPAHTLFPGRPESTRMRIQRQEYFAVRLHRWHVLLPAPVTPATPSSASADSSNSPAPSPSA